MNILDVFARKYAEYCPKCNQELNLFFYGSNGLDTFKCVQCQEYYQKSNSQLLELTNTPLLPFQRYEESLKNYEGFPSSYAYAPKWLTRLRRIF